MHLRPSDSPCKFAAFPDSPAHFGEGQLYIAAVVPTGKRVGEEDRETLFRVRLCTEAIEQEIELQLRYCERRSEDFEADHPFVEGA